MIILIIINRCEYKYISLSLSGWCVCDYCVVRVTNTEMCNEMNLSFQRAHHHRSFVHLSFFSRLLFVVERVKGIALAFCLQLRPTAAFSSHTRHVCVICLFGLSFGFDLLCNFPFFALAFSYFLTVCVYSAAHHFFYLVNTQRLSTSCRRQFLFSCSAARVAFVIMKQ